MTLQAGAWAKLRRLCKEGRGEQCRAVCDCPISHRLSLVAHGADVAAVMAALLSRPAIRDRLGRLLGTGTLEEVDCARLVALAGLHDVGKVNVDFQSGKAGHIGPVLAALVAGKLTAAMGLKDALPLLYEGGREAPMLAMLAHHGSLPGSPPGLKVELWQSVGSYSPAAEGRRLVDAVRSWVPVAFGGGVVDFR